MTRRLKNLVFLAMTTAAMANPSMAKDCSSSDFDIKLANGYCDLPSDGTRISGTSQSVGDAFYALDCEDVSGGNPGPAVEGLNRLFLTETQLDCNGPVVGSEAGIVLYGPPERLVELDSRELDMFLDRTEVVGVNGSGPIKIGVLTDAVYRDTTDDSLVLAMDVKLFEQLPQNESDGPCPDVEFDPDDPQVEGCVANESEFNFILRSGNTGFAVQAASAERRNGSLYLYNAARTTAKTLNGATPFNPDWVRFQTDLNAEEKNPTSRFFFMKTDAECYDIGTGSIEANQAGEEGQPQVSVFLDGYVTTSCDVPGGPAETVPVAPWWALAGLGAVLATFGVRAMRGARS